MKSRPGFVSTGFKRGLAALQKIIAELEEYEREILYPLATRKLAIDLDDGMRVNYPKFGSALKKIPKLEGGNEDYAEQLESLIWQNLSCASALKSLSVSNIILQAAEQA